MYDTGGWHADAAAPITSFLVRSDSALTAASGRQLQDPFLNTKQINQQKKKKKKKKKKKIKWYSLFYEQ
jgi:hypothetical protein